MKPSSITSIRPISFHWETRDPFIFCVHHHDFYPNGNEAMGPDASLAGRHMGNDFSMNSNWRMYHGDVVPGFPVHPHRGFETVTVVREGFVDHSDSAGAAGRYGEGDVQWMTAGSGLQHAEMFPLLKKDSDNTLELFQIWLNLPASKKFSKPHFKMLWDETIPKPVIKDENGKSVYLELVAGEYGSSKAPAPAPDSWAADPANEVCIWIMKMDAGATFELPASAAITNRTLYYFSGEGAIIDGAATESGNAADLKWENPVTIKNGKSESRFLFLQGKPIGEHVEQYGPFVMNTRAEILETMDDYRKTGFGGWPWPRPDNVHDRDEGRFGKYPDGRVEKP